jgi:hypothetical protein
MRTIATASLAGLLLATPALAQSPNIQQLLGGLMTGNRSQDQSLQEAYERGYRHGREDQAREMRAERGRYRDDRGPDQPYPPPPRGYDQR